MLNNIGFDVKLYSTSYANFTIFGSKGSIDFRFVQTNDNWYSYHIRQRDLDLNSAFSEISTCFNLQPYYWYGGPAQKMQIWPVEELKIIDYPYKPRYHDQMHVAERYWLNSAGSFIFVRDYSSLYVTQDINDQGLCISTRNSLDYSVLYQLNFVIGVGIDSRDAHLHARSNYLVESIVLPNAEMINRPIWSTGARFGRDINETAVLQFADEIEKSGFEHGQIAIDDQWEECYGTLTFDKIKFPNIKNLTEQLRQRGFKTTLWVHPFVNKECGSVFDEGVKDR